MALLGAKELKAVNPKSEYFMCVRKTRRELVVTFKISFSPVTKK